MDSSDPSSSSFLPYLPDELWCRIVEFAFTDPAKIFLIIAPDKGGSEKMWHQPKLDENTRPLDRIPIQLLLVNRMFLEEGRRTLYTKLFAFEKHALGSDMVSFFQSIGPINRTLLQDIEINVSILMTRRLGTFLDYAAENMRVRCIRFDRGLSWSHDPRDLAMLLPLLDLLKRGLIRRELHLTSSSERRLRWLAAPLADLGLASEVKFVRGFAECTITAVARHDAQQLEGLHRISPTHAMLSAMRETPQFRRKISTRTSVIAFYRKRAVESRNKRPSQTEHMASTLGLEPGHDT